MNITENQKAELRAILGENLSESNLNRLIRYAQLGQKQPKDLEANIQEIVRDYISSYLSIVVYRNHDDKIVEIDLRLEGCLISSAN